MADREVTAVITIATGSGDGWSVVGPDGEESGGGMTWTRPGRHTVRAGNAVPDGRLRIWRLKERQMTVQVDSDCFAFAEKAGKRLREYFTGRRFTFYRGEELHLRADIWDRMECIEVRWNV